MAEDVDRWLGNLDGAAARDRRNGACRRNLLSEPGDIELKVPRLTSTVFGSKHLNLKDSPS